MSDDLRIVAHTVQTSLLELADLVQNGPVLKIVHRFWVPGTGCWYGEEVWAISIVRRGKEFRLPLPLALRLLLNYLAETRHVPQSATQIAAGMRGLAFYTKHGTNSGIPSRRKLARSTVKEYVKRLRRAFDLALREAGLNLEPRSILVSRKTMGNEVQYQLRATIQLVHVANVD